MSLLNLFLCSSNIMETKAAQVFCKTRLGFIYCYSIGKSMGVKASKVSSGQDSLVPQWKWYS